MSNSYDAHEWQSLELIAREKVNHMEQGIAQAHERIDSLNSEMTTVAQAATNATNSAAASQQASEAAAAYAQNVVIVDDEQPTNNNNKIWVDTSLSTQYQVPTWAEHQELAAAIQNIAPTIKTTYIDKNLYTNYLPIYRPGTFINSEGTYYYTPTFAHILVRIEPGDNIRIINKANEQNTEIIFAFYSQLPACSDTQYEIIPVDGQFHGATTYSESLIGESIAPAGSTYMAINCDSIPFPQVYINDYPIMPFTYYSEYATNLKNLNPIQQLHEANMASFNAQFYQCFENGDLDSTSGAILSSTTAIRTKYFINIKPTDWIYWSPKDEANYLMTAFFYDKQGTFISSVAMPWYQMVTIPTNAYLMKCAISSTTDLQNIPVIKDNYAILRYSYDTALSINQFIN